MKTVIGESALAVTSGKAGMQQAFSMQYTSLILIILSCIIGSFARDAMFHTKPVALKQPVLLEEKLEEVRAPAELGSLELSDVFEEGLADIHPSAVAGILEFLKNHDAGVEISVFGETGQNEKEALGLALARSISLFRYFTSQGIPPEAVRSFAHTGVQRGMLRFVFTGAEHK